SFVEAGGTLVADYRCGLRDLHGRLRPTPALDDVFGIRRESRDVHRARARVTMNYRDRCGAQFESIFHDAIVADGARIDGTHDDGSPALLVHTFGEGTAIYLNCDLYAYEEMRRRGTERDLRELGRNLLVYDADLFAPFLVAHEHGHAAPHTEVTRWHDGPARYYGVLRDFVQDDKAPMRVSLPFPQGGHVYEVRSHRYLGMGPGSDTLEAGQP
ncbi:MAG: hypothetical protein GY851_31635, partial [bacterium]|nr:hypothetical protein [bacterium]